MRPQRGDDERDLISDTFQDSIYSTIGGPLVIGFVADSWKKCDVGLHVHFRARHIQGYYQDFCAVFHRAGCHCSAAHLGTSRQSSNFGVPERGGGLGDGNCLMFVSVVEFSQQRQGGVPIRVRAIVRLQALDQCPNGILIRQVPDSFDGIGKILWRVTDGKHELVPKGGSLRPTSGQRQAVDGVVEGAAEVVQAVSGHDAPPFKVCFLGNHEFADVARSISIAFQDESIWCSLPVGDKFSFENVEVLAPPLELEVGNRRIGPQGINNTDCVP